MKLKNIFALMALSLCFTACSDDDDPVIDGENGEEEVVVKELLGDYIGVKNLILKDDFSPKIHHVAQLLEGKEKGEYTLVLPFEQGTSKVNFDESRHGGMPAMPKIVLDDVELTKGEDGTYTYTDDEEVVGSGETQVTVTKLEVTIKGTAMKISWKAQPNGMPFALTYTFEGDKNEKIVPMPSFAEELLKNKFVGVLKSKVGDEAMDPDSCEVKIFGQNNGKFTVRLPKSTSKATKSARAMKMPIVEIKDVVLTEGADKTYTFTAGKMDVPTPTMTIALDKVSLSIKGADMDFVYDMKPGNMPIWINNHFSTNFKEEEKPVEPEVPAVTVDAYKIEGYYVGDNKMSVAGKDQGVMKDLGISVKPQDNKTISLFIAGSADGPMPFPTIELKNLEVSVAADSTYTFTLAEKVLDVNGMKITLKNVKGSAKEGKLNLTYNAIPGDMPMPISFTYEGTKTAEPINPDATAADVVPGTFVGMNATSMVEMPEDAPELAKYSMVVTAQKDGKFSIQLPEAVEEEQKETKAGMSMPTMVIKDLEAVKGEDGVFTIAVDALDMDVAGKNAHFTDLKASFAQNGKGTFTCKLKYGRMPLTVVYDFKGYKESK